MNTPPESFERQMQIAPPGGHSAAAELSPEQLRFHALTEQIVQARATLASWETQIPVFHRAHVKRIVPLIDELHESRRASVELVDALLDQPGWSKAEAASLRAWLLERAGEILASESTPDTALLAVFIKHGGVTPDSFAPPVSDAAATAEKNAAPAPDEDADLRRQFEEELAAEAARAAAREEAKAARARSGKAKKKSTAQLKRETAAEEALQSVREVFRKLVSALHPDREPDADRRAEKTVLMQRVNGAYAANDLLALLELQRELAPADDRWLQGASSQRLAHYNQVLATQVAELKAEIVRVQLQFQSDFGLVPDGLLNPDRLDRLVDRAYREVSEVLAEQQREIRLLTDRSATRQWLRHLARHLRW